MRWRPPQARLLERWLRQRRLAGPCRRRYGLARGTGWVLENTLFRPQQGSEDAAAQDVRSANNMNDATQPQHFSLRTGSSTSGSPASSRASSQSFRAQAQSNTPRPFSWGLNPVTLPRPRLKKMHGFARFCAKCYSSSAYLHVGTRGIAFARFCSYSSSAYINIDTKRIAFARLR